MACIESSYLDRIYYIIPAITWGYLSGHASRLQPDHSTRLSDTNMANVQSVKIVARLRPPIPGELSDQGIRIVTTDGDDDLPAICVNNPRDPSQVFKFP